MYDVEKVIEYTQNIKLLYVEDNKDARETTARLLKNLFPDITVAVDGKDGVEKFKENQIDLIITDLNMPKMNGAQMIKEIRMINNLIPIIALSAHDEDEYIISSIKRGVCVYLNKPIKLNELFEAIYIALNPKARDIRPIYDTDSVFQKYKDTINPDSIVNIFNPNGIVLYVNDTFAHIFGFPKDEIIGRPYYTLSKEKHDEELISEIWETIKIKKQVWAGTMRYVNNFDEVYFLRGSIHPIFDENGKIIEYVSIREDITQEVLEELKKFGA